MDAFSVSLANGLNEPKMKKEKFGTKLSDKAQILGGVILILIGIEIFAASLL